MRYQSGRMIAAPNTTNLGSSASPTNELEREIAAAPVNAAATQTPSAAFVDRGMSGRPKPYAVTQRITA